MLLRPFLNDVTSRASYLFGCGYPRQACGRRPARRARRRLPRHRGGAGRADRGGLRDTRASRPRLRPTGARRAHELTAYLPAGAGVEFDHVALADGDVVELGNTFVTAIATPGHAPAHHAYTVADRRR